MKIDLIISADYIGKEKIEGKNVVIIDVLRATSVIVTALNNGCSKVIPVLSKEEAFSYKDSSTRTCILGGERNALKIQGFNCSNSPLEYSREVIEGKNLIITTSNGTRAIRNCEYADNVFIGAMINARAVAKKVCNLGQDLVIVNSGTDGEFSMDDFICAGYIMQKIIEIKNDVELSDIANTAFISYKNHEDILSFVKEAYHYKRLKNLGLNEDLKYCMQKDIINKVPQCIGGEIK